MAGDQKRIYVKIAWELLNLTLLCLLLLVSQANPSIKMAATLSDVKTHHLPTDEKFRVTGKALDAALKQDIENGLIPFFVSDLLTVILA